VKRRIFEVSLNAICNNLDCFFPREKVKISRDSGIELGGREEIMAPEYLKGLVFVLGLAAVILVAAAFGEWYLQRKVER
jgi:hypothetical protein